ncbi:FAD-dependent oxidoreductase [Streptomyces sp. NBC_00063]|uniref:FAD-dependent oxidoreductase n=1 Tax=Streptomyces sp. NBC_00063 TaxID=2975638 RepID=UPI003D732FA4
MRCPLPGRRPGPRIPASRSRHRAADAPRCHRPERDGGDRVTGVRLSDGSRVPADVVVGIGVEPATDWLASSGLHLDNGVLCAGNLAALDAPGIVAAGDVARSDHPGYGYPVRIEHCEKPCTRRTPLPARSLREKRRPRSTRSRCSGRT